jgi:hypothetical protein
VADGREDRHVDAALGDQHLRRAQLDAGDRAEELDRLGLRLCDVGDALIEGFDREVEAVDVGEQLHDEHAVMGEIEAVRERLAQLRDLRAEPATRELGQLGRVGDPSQQGLEHRPRRDRVAGRGDAGQLDPGGLQHLLQALDRPCALLDLRLAQAGEVAQAADLRRRTKLGRTNPCSTS